MRRKNAPKKGEDTFQIPRQKSYTSFRPGAYTGTYTSYKGGVSMQHTHQDETTLRTGPQEDVDDLIFRAAPGWTASER